MLHCLVQRESPTRPSGYYADIPRRKAAKNGLDQSVSFSCPHNLYVRISAHPSRAQFAPPVLAPSLVSLFRWKAVLNCLHENE